VRNDVCYFFPSGILLKFHQEYYLMKLNHWVKKIIICLLMDFILRGISTTQQPHLMSEFNVDAFSRDILEDPINSLTCKAQIDYRQKKINLKQKAHSLILLSEKILGATPENRKKLIDKLSYNLTQLRQQILILDLHIEDTTEKIVRKGCPGITL
jgi:hypothetical protein